MNSYIDLLQEVQGEEYIFTSHVATVPALTAFLIQVERLKELEAGGYTEIMELHFEPWSGGDYVDAVRVRITDKGKHARTQINPDPVDESSST